MVTCTAWRYRVLHTLLPVLPCRVLHTLLPLELGFAYHEQQGVLLDAGRQVTEKWFLGVAMGLGS